MLLPLTPETARMTQDSGAQLVADGGRGSLTSLDAFEDRYQDGDTGELHISMSLIPPGTSKGLQLAMQLGGVPLNGEVHSIPGRIIVVPFKKGIAPLLLLAIVLGIFFVGFILLLVTAWALFRNVGAALLVFGFLAIAIVAAVVLIGGGGRRAKARA